MSIYYRAFIEAENNVNNYVNQIKYYCAYIDPGYLEHQLAYKTCSLIRITISFSQIEVHGLLATDEWSVRNFIEKNYLDIIFAANEDGSGKNLKIIPFYDV